MSLRRPVANAADPIGDLRPASDPFRVWLEELLGPELRRQGTPRDAALSDAALREMLADGGQSAWQRLRREHVRH
ncbi:hypothetical protein [Novosphingobium lentum]|uniref:hypothetical protein n=1 Tax=Novosphingobium lentum TaxID=145287 RepID=UPI0008376F52|nr:hypothetical protein [Novosphingobium lentum]